MYDIDGDEKKMELWYPHIGNKNKYLSCFYDTSLKLPQPNLRIVESSKIARRL